MDCLSQEELAQLALGLDVEADISAHLGKCGNCQADIVRLRSLTDQLSAAHEKMYYGHDESRERLLANLPVIHRQPQPQSAIVSKILYSWIVGLNMKQRIALSSVSAAVVLGLMVLWSAFAIQPISAMERMRESISKATSYKSNSTLEFGLYPNKPVSTTISVTHYWTASGSRRYELKGKGVLSYINSTAILPAGKPGIEFVHTTREFRHGPPGANRDYSGAKLLQELGKYSGQADRELGTRIIDGREVLGFVIDTKKIDFEGLFGSGYFGFLEVWIDTKTNLPLKLRVEMKNAVTQTHPIKAMSMSIQWNVELDAKLFDPTPPNGYLDNTPRPRTPKIK